MLFGETNPFSTDAPFVDDSRNGEEYLRPRVAGPPEKKSGGSETADSAHVRSTIERVGESRGRSSPRQGPGSRTGPPGSKVSRVREIKQSSPGDQLVELGKEATKWPEEWRLR